jgi:hypothetical protein
VPGMRSHPACRGELDPFSGERPGNERPAQDPIGWPALPRDPRRHDTPEAAKPTAQSQEGGAERRRNRTYQPPGYDGLPVLKTGWGTSPVPLRAQG